MFLIHMKRGFEFALEEIEKIRLRTSTFDFAKLENILNETIKIKDEEMTISGDPKRFLNALAKLNERLTPVYEEEFKMMIDAMRKMDKSTTIGELIVRIDQKEFLAESNPQFRAHIITELRKNGYTTSTKIGDVIKTVARIDRGLIGKLKGVLSAFKETELPGQEFDIIAYQKGKLPFDLNAAMVIKDGVIPLNGGGVSVNGSGQNSAEIKALLVGWKNALPRLKQILHMNDEEFGNWIQKLRKREMAAWVDYASLVEYNEPTDHWFINTAKNSWNSGKKKFGFLHDTFLKFTKRIPKTKTSLEYNAQLEKIELTILQQYLVNPSKAGFQTVWDNMLIAWLSNIIPSLPNSGMLSQLARGRIFSWQMFQFKRLLLLPILLIPNFFLNTYFNEVGLKGTMANFTWSFVYGQITGFIAQIFWNGMDMDQRLANEGKTNKERIEAIGDFFNLIEHDPLWDPR